MYQRLARLRAKRAAGEVGFTLIELLVVVVIIGILIAIAIPVYLNYQKGAKDKSAQSDLRNAVSVLEQCNSDNASYPTAIGTSGISTASVGLTVATNGCLGQLNLSAGTKFTYFPSTAATPPAYIVTATNTGGSGKIYCYSSVAGGAVATTAAALTAYPTTGTPVGSCPA